MQKLIRTLGFAMLSFSLAACHLVYVPDVQQGNILTKKNLDQLKPGMTKHQVLVLLGTPSVTTPFEQDRWDYVATQQHRGGPITVRHLTLTFNNDTLVRTEGKFFQENAEQMAKQSSKYRAGYSVDDDKGDKTMAPDDASGDSSDGQ